MKAFIAFARMLPLLPNRAKRVRYLLYFPAFSRLVLKDLIYDTDCKSVFFGGSLSLFSALFRCLPSLMPQAQLPDFA